MKKRMTAFLLAFCLMAGSISAIIPTASAASVTTDDMASLVNAANSALGKTAYDLGIPNYGWCGYFTGWCINNSGIAARLGTIPEEACRFAMSPVSWVCGTKDAGRVYMTSPIHLARLEDICYDLKGTGKIVQVNSSTFTPLPGDLVMFTWQAWAVHEFSHIGIVTAVNGGSITYVDGNSGTGNGRVASHVMNKTSANIIGYIRFDTNKTLPPSDPSEYFDCDVMISCVNGQVVNLYNNPGDSVRADYFSLGQAVRSTYGVNMCDGATWYQITAASLGVVKTFWLKYESGKMTVDNFQPSQSTSCSHTWDAGTETVSPTLTSSGTRLRTCTICGEKTTEAIEHLTSVSGTCGDNAHWRIDDQGTLTISGTGKVVYQPWHWDEYPKTENRDTVKRIVVEKGITELSAGAVSHLPNAVSVELPQSLTSISGDAFWQCYSLKDVTIPAQVSYLHPQAFRECTSLASIKVDEANPFLCSYEGAVFSKDMRELICFPDGRDGSFCVPGGVTLIGNRVFSWCMALKELQLPQSVGYIGSDAFPGQDKVSTDAPGKTALTLVVPKGSYAEQYAIESSMDYRAVDVPTQAEPDRVQVTIDLGTTKTNHLDRFKTVKVYRDGSFQDVSSGAWYAENVAAVYELGLMRGTAERTFEPGKNVTIAEAITLAARLHSVYYADGAAFEPYDGGAWYDAYVNYMRDNGLLSENYDYNRPATREEFVHILARALPDEALMPILPSAPDFIDAGNILYKSDVDQLSRAGVITGNGGSFFPKNTITRTEAAAVVTRMAKPELRKG